MVIMDESIEVQREPEQSTAPGANSPSRVSAFQKIIFWGIFIFLIIFCYVFYEVYVPISSDPAEIAFEVKKGESVRAIADDLKEKNLIRSSSVFRLYTRIQNISRNIQAGSYTLQKDMSMRRVLNVLSEDASSAEEVITIPEGWTIKDIGAYLESKNLSSSEGFLGATRNEYSNNFSFLSDRPANEKKTGNPRTWRAEQSSYDGNPLEGYLFPDTYRLYKDASADDVIRKMLGNFDRKLTKDMRNEIILQRKTIYEIVTIASLIEKEVKSPEDKVLVSGILWKRLQLKIALQVDASIIYIKTNGRSQLNGGEKVLYEDLKIDSPYNTYKYRGLPPGPISNPGLESIEAAIYPKQSPYLFYISTPDGKTIYSKTLEEHNTAVAKYLR